MGKSYIVPVEVESLDEGGYLAICPTIPGCHAQGDSIAQVIDIVQDIARIILELRVEHGQGIPDELEEAKPETLPAVARILIAVE